MKSDRSSMADPNYDDTGDSSDWSESDQNNWNSEDDNPNY